MPDVRTYEDHQRQHIIEFLGRYYGEMEKGMVDIQALVAAIQWLVDTREAAALKEYRKRGMGVITDRAGEELNRFTEEIEEKIGRHPEA